MRVKNQKMASRRTPGEQTDNWKCFLAFLQKDLLVFSCSVFLPSMFKASVRLSLSLKSRCVCVLFCLRARNSRGQKTKRRLTDFFFLISFSFSLLLCFFFFSSFLSFSHSGFCFQSLSPFPVLVIGGSRSASVAYPSLCV